MSYARNPAGQNQHGPSLPRRTPTPTSIPTSKLGDDDLRRLGTDEIIRRLRQSESEKIQAVVDRGNVMKDFNQRMQALLGEMRNLKEVNQKLQDESQELRDLCCFLDDDRQKGRKLAKEWQRFGRYTSSVMKSEVSAYQDKLKELERQQGELVKENLSLKELCIYLDEDLKRLRRGVSYDRDQGDGSSSSSAGDKPEEASPLSDYNTDLSRPRALLTEQTLQYIRGMEEKISRLEQENRQVGQRSDRSSSDGERSDSRKYFSSPSLHQLDNAEPTTLSGKPAAIAHAMKVLEVHEQIEKPMSEQVHDGDGDVMDEEDKALLRNLCNVVWDKLGAEPPSERDSQH